MIENIRSPKDLKGLTHKQLATLASEIRFEIIDTVSENGGHLASNLGIVETVLAVHRVFDMPADSLIFDVGHQAYAHKIITGRFENFKTLRQKDGISGFTCREESEYDTVTVGHCGTSISTAVGIAEANKLSGNGKYTVVIVGDGSFTNGEIWEALNNCAGRGLKLIIILNDNEMSISPNVGAMARYLVKVSNSRKYFTAKHNIKRFFRRVPLIGNGLIAVTKWLKDALKHIYFSNNLFEALGLEYLGPINGMNQVHLEDVLREAKSRSECTLVHIITKKGAGYRFAEEKPEIYHAVSAFDSEIGVVQSDFASFSSAFGNELMRLAAEDDKICAITAAMRDGTGLSKFADVYPDRFFDVGIAEEHAVTFSAGLALAGYKPVCVMYSTFAQRVYDQIWQDAALQKLPVVFAFDRAGFVGNDGYTHQGLYDVSLMRSIPGVSIYSPATYSELKRVLGKSINGDAPSIIRYPKGQEIKGLPEMTDAGDFSYTANNAESFVISYGRAIEFALSEMMADESENTAVLKLLKIYPIDFDAIMEVLSGCKRITVIEEGIKSGSLAEYLISGLAERGTKFESVKIRAVDGEFVAHDDAKQLMKKYLSDGKI